MTAHVEAGWPGGARQMLRAMDLSQCTHWLSQWNVSVTASTIYNQCSAFDLTSSD